MTYIKILILFCGICLMNHAIAQDSGLQVRERISINNQWKFYRDCDTCATDQLIYDKRPPVKDFNSAKIADSRPSETENKPRFGPVLKNWILPTANSFINDSSMWYKYPNGTYESSFPFLQNDFDESGWETVNLPHDWAAGLSFYQGENPLVGGGMGRLPVQGVGWYRKKIDVPVKDRGRKIFIDIDGAMSYAMVWLNGSLVGGWPYGYNSFRLDLTPYINFGSTNQLAIRIDNPNYSSRWYPGAGIYRNVWLVKTNPVRIAHWGTAVATPVATHERAIINLAVNLVNESEKYQEVIVRTGLFTLGADFKTGPKKVADFPGSWIVLAKNETKLFKSEIILSDPLLWGPLPTQQPNLYQAVSKVYRNGKIIDEYTTTFGIRDVRFDPVNGVFINGQPVRIRGVNMHHDLGALGAAFNSAAAERQLEILAEMGCNAIRMAHNPPAPELLEMTDRMGFLVIDEIFDSWQAGKNPHDFHLIFDDWSEADLRSFIRRDRNHPSVVVWSVGNEVGEQYSGEEGAEVAKRLYHIAKEEDDTRPVTSAMNYAKPDMPFPQIFDIVSLNYQGEGIRDAPAYGHLKGIRTSPQYPAFHKKFPDKLILSSETASDLSSRGFYTFPVFAGVSAPVSQGIGGDSLLHQVSSYDLYTAQFGASPDKVFINQDKNTFVAGEFVWTGFDYIGEPTPYYSARSSYSGIIDLAGFKKDRFYLYQSRWRPDFPMAHILPHWNWHDRVGMTTPVHVYSSADEAELFLDGRSLGRKKKEIYEYRFRWDDVIYQPGELKVVTYKNGREWAVDVVRTSDEPYALEIVVNKNTLKRGANDLSFLTIRVVDKNGNMVPVADNEITFTVSGAGEIIATGNGNPADFEPFVSHNRKAFNGKALAIVRSKDGQRGMMVIHASSSGLKPASIKLTVE